MALVDDLIGLDCEGLETTECVLFFADFLDQLELETRAENPADPDPKTIKESVREAIEVSIATFQAELDKINAKIAGYRAAIGGLEAEVEALQAKLAQITDAIGVIDSYLAEFPCPQLEPIRAMLEIVRVLIAAQIALVDISGLTALLDAALSQVGVLTVPIECLNKMLEILE
jgi:hypothetical protein